MLAWQNFWEDVEVKYMLERRLIFAASQFGLIWQEFFPTNASQVTNMTSEKMLRVYA